MTLFSEQDIILNISGYRHGICLIFFLSVYLDDPADDELSALLAAGGKEDVEVMFAVLAPFKLVEHSWRANTDR